MTFASPTLREHLLRGVIAAALLTTAAWWSDAQPLLSLGAVVAAVLALRGCPSCWVVGLFETIRARAQGRPTEGLCTDGRCARARDDAPGPGR